MSSGEMDVGVLAIVGELRVTPSNVVTLPRAKAMAIAPANIKLFM
jgi:hypothetical protein